MRARGYSLPFVIMILLLLSVTLASLLFVLNAGARSTESMLGRRKLFYACDGLSRIAAVSAQNYFATTATPDSTGLRDFICTEGGNCTGCTADGCTGGLTTFSSQTPGFSVNSFNIANLGNRRIAPLDSGPFQGMIAMQDGVDLRLGAQKNGTGWKCDVTQELSLGKIAMFQFFIFSDQEYTDWTPGPKMAGTGRVHTNGDVCFYGDDGPLYVERVTSSGKIYPGPTTGCRSSEGTNARTAARVAIVDVPTFDTNTGNTDPIEPAAHITQGAVATSTSHFREFSTRTESTWVNDANTLFARHLQDVGHGVPPLKLPVFGATTIQNGRNSSLAIESNTGRSRLLVDPVLSGDDDTVAQQKFAFKADIRIINGVWYKRDESNPKNIGTVIWSDHPGSVTTTAQEGIIPASINVGQNDIFPSTGSRPKRYSYYTFTNTGNFDRAESDTTPAVVSYGVLHRSVPSGGTPIWGPGVRCSDGSISSVFGGGACNGLSNSVGQRLLSGARSGFRDGHAQNQFSATDERANILPINIDVAALQNALATCTDDELGSHFPRSCQVGGTGRAFNGIVFVSTVWPGAMNATPTVPPPQGTRNVTNKTPVAPTAGGGVIEQMALPEPLCTNSTLANPQGGGVATGFNHVACASYAGTLSNATVGAGARPTAVRVFNARNIDQMATASGGQPALSTQAQGLLTRAPPVKGLSIISNLPMYVMGDVNLASDPANLATTAPWVPMLVAGDLVTLLSNNWTDNLARWSVTMGTNRPATTTTYNMEMLAGWLPSTTTAFSGGLHNFPRFMETWSNVPARIRGSLVVGWAAVFAQWKRECCGTTSYQAPNRDWGFDKHLESILNQPPGAPLYDVQSTRRWKR